MFTGASTANVAILLVDVTKEITEQTKRHLFIISLLKIQHLVICINKMDLVNYEQEKFIDCKSNISKLFKKLSIPDIRFIPCSAVFGQNLTIKSKKIKWYKGSDLLTIIENIHVMGDFNNIDLRVPIQFSEVKSKKDQLERFFFGKVLSGSLRIQDSIRILPNGMESKIKKLYKGDKIVDVVESNTSFSFSLSDQVDLSRGDMITKLYNLPIIDQSFDAIICWFSNLELDTAKRYLININNKQCFVKIKEIQYVVDLSKMSRDELLSDIKINDIGRVRLLTSEKEMFDKYSQNKQTGGFILIDEGTNQTIAGGLVV